MLFGTSADNDCNKLVRCLVERTCMGRIRQVKYVEIGQAGCTLSADRVSDNLSDLGSSLPDK